MWLDNFNEMRRQSGLSLDELSENPAFQKELFLKFQLV